ncbi:MAG: riboflavin synthase, alpha subunit [Gammaproteobacteria bacterium]|jgi:riboflavin synthase|nr:riboflavin synthase, alpha subunit [Gammaproteobacteria bacterium]
MITGIVQGIARVVKVDSKTEFKTLTIQTDLSLDDLSIGDSIAINGVCLTLTSIRKDSFTVDVMEETLKKTNLFQLSEGSQINIEKMMLLTSRVNGHLVQGHVDTTAKIMRLWFQNNAMWLGVEIPKELKPYIVSKGSICLDGMSLTVVDVLNGYFTVSLIPHTQEVTIAKNYQVGRIVNLEADLIAKQLAKLLEGYYENGLGKII